MTRRAAIGTFKTEASYFLASDPETAIAIQGVFDKAHRLVDHTGAPVDSVKAVLGIDTADLEETPEGGDEVLVLGVRYRVEEVAEDGQGGATLILGRL